jgi:peptidoglycan/xylan/chitin deacetylase (PgdA/CDA1 family)
MSVLIDSDLLRPVRRKFIIWRARRRTNAVALTFDDGPDPELTQELLALLMQERVPATFFLVGTRAEKSPHLVRQMAADGHETGIHTFSHRTMAELGCESYANEIERTAGLIRDLTRREPLLFRPPFGEYSLQLLWLMIKRRTRCILWSVDFRDYTVKNKDVLVQLQKEALLVGGDILLFHDSQRVTVEAMPAIIRDIRSRGLAFATISQLLGNPSGGQAKEPVPRFRGNRGSADVRPQESIISQA